jgi:hypothetical protein
MFNKQMYLWSVQELENACISEISLLGSYHMLDTGKSEEITSGIGFSQAF